MIFIISKHNQKPKWNYNEDYKIKYHWNISILKYLFTFYSLKI